MYLQARSGILFILYTFYISHSFAHNLSPSFERLMQPSARFFLSLLLVSPNSLPLLFFAHSYPMIVDCSQNLFVQFQLHSNSNSSTEKRYNITNKYALPIKGEKERGSRLSWVDKSSLHEFVKMKFQRVENDKLVLSAMSGLFGVRE